MRMDELIEARHASGLGENDGAEFRAIDAFIGGEKTSGPNSATT